MTHGSAGNIVWLYKIREIGDMARRREGEVVARGDGRWMIRWYGGKHLVEDGLRTNLAVMR